ncbi:MAG: purine-nucleoside phosphorylase [Clostridiales bacterium]|jgi:purine-nucleoside phosphorylase|nr:purine-nucleoside phosphorylase [Clostridiales bacterium]
MSVPTPHINAKQGDFAKTVLMPGDSRRAEFIARNFLDQTKMVTDVRDVRGFTGFYQDKPVSLMASGMGIPSIGIYAYELYNFYNVENIIRIGTCGAVSERSNLLDIIISVGASYDSSFDLQYQLPGKFSAAASYQLLKQIDACAAKLGMTVHFGNTVTCDSFYGERQAIPAWKKMGILAVEMEAAGLYMTASANGRNAATMMTVVDSIYTGESLSSMEREQSLTDMIKIALETAIRL